MDRRNAKKFHFPGDRELLKGHESRTTSLLNNISCLSRFSVEMALLGKTFSMEDSQFFGTSRPLLYNRPIFFQEYLRSRFHVLSEEIAIP